MYVNKMNKRTDYWKAAYSNRKNSPILEEGNRICTNCAIEKSIQDFNKHPRMRGGRFTVCKSCTYKRAAQYRQENIENIKKYDREYIKSNPLIKQNRIDKVKRWSGKNPNASKASRVVRMMLKNGLIIKDCCSVCASNTNIIPVWKDYKEPFLFSWICRKCRQWADSLDK